MTTQPRLLAQARDPRPTTTLFYGGGQDSHAILTMLGEDPALRARYAPGHLTVIISATGDEYRETDGVISRAAEYCQARGIEYLHVTPDLGYHSVPWRTLHTQWERNHTVNSAAYRRFRTCTPNLKIMPSYAALNDLIARRYGYAACASGVRYPALRAYHADFGPMPVLIGFSEGEQRRVKPMPEPLATLVTRAYPLIDHALTRAGAQEITRVLGGEAVMPSNCRNCHFATHQDLLYLHATDPGSFQTWAAYEQRKLAHPKWVDTRNHTVFANDLTLAENLEVAHGKYGHLSPEELTRSRFCRGHQVGSGY